MASKPRLYSNRLNKDGSSDSICLTCFATVGGCEHDRQRAQHDKAYICDSAFLAERGIFTGSKSPKPAPVRTGAHGYMHAGEAA